MATDNKSLTVYLETEILEALTDYCLSNGITRKDKTTPILATGAVNLLKQALGLSPTLTSTLQVRDEQTEKKFSTIEDRLGALEIALGSLQKNKPVKDATEETPNDGEGLTGVALAKKFPEEYGVKCSPEYLSLFLANSPRCPAKVREILEKHWIYQARRWYPKTQKGSYD